jgi:hypothetical protein
MTPHSAPRPILPLQSADSIPGREALTIPEAPLPKVTTQEAFAKLTARISEAPPNSHSYATLGSAALDASQPELPQTRSRKGWGIAVGVILVAALVATGVSFSMFRPKGTASRAAAASPSPPKPAATATQTTATASPPPATATTAPAPAATVTDGSSGIPTLSASALPKATPKITWMPPPRWTPPPAAVAPPPTATAVTPAPAPAPAPAPTGPKPKPKVDDGF